MDHELFDALTKGAASGVGNRRRALRALGGALLAGAAARLGLTGVGEAKPKRHRGGHKRKADVRRAHQPTRGAQAAGKGRSKKKKQHRRTPPAPPLPPGPQCAADEKRCVEPESSTGFSCVGLNDCCPDEKKCGAGCIYRKACCGAERPQCGPCDEAYCDSQGNYHCSGTCCPNEKPCPGGGCVPKNACCPGQRRCDNGSCISVGCCSGEHECPGGVCYPAGTCCLGQKKCPDGECIDKNACCPNEAPPVCGECEVARCVAGSWDCWPDNACGSCGEGYCPPGIVMRCTDPGICCGIPTGGTYTECFCAIGYTLCSSGHCCRTGCCGSRCCEVSPA
jgi:hypothetical protein